jgi:membrane associated rhomboid family serine protease
MRHDFWTSLAALLILAGTIALVGWYVRKWVARKSEADRIRGWFVYGFAVGSYVAGGLFGLIAEGTTEAMGGMAAFGLVFGILQGLVIGSIVAFLRRRPESEAES